MLSHWKVSVTHAFGEDDNRSYLEEAGFLQSVVSLLEGYAEQVVTDNFDPLPLSLLDLKIVRTAIGVLLNASIGFGEWLDNAVLGMPSEFFPQSRSSPSWWLLKHRSLY